MGEEGDLNIFDIQYTLYPKNSLISPPDRGTGVGCLEFKARHEASPPSLVAPYDMSRKLWAAHLFFLSFGMQGVAATSGSRYTKGKIRKKIALPTWLFRAIAQYFIKRGET